VKDEERGRETEREKMTDEERERERATSAYFMNP